MADKIAVLSIKGDGPKGLEGETAQRVMRHLLAEKREKPVDVFEVDRDKSLTIKDIYAYGKYDVYVVINGTVFITHESIHALSRIIANSETLSAVAPVSNESDMVFQRHTPSFFYQTISVLRWAVEETYREFKDTVVEVDGIDDFCFALRREFLDGLPADYALMNLLNMMKKSGLRFGIATEQ